MQVELTEEHLDFEPSWFESVATEFIHLPKVDLNDWRGVEEEGVPDFQEWWVCINNRGLEEPNWNVDKCRDKPGKRNWYTLSCENVYNDTSKAFEAQCEYCVTPAGKNQEPVCTTGCEQQTSYLTEFKEEVFDVRCIDPFYAIELENRYKPTAPPALRIIFQIISVFFELHVVTLAIAPWYLIQLVLMFVDFLIDWIWYLIFFAYCLPCAWTFIWLFNIVFLPFQVWSYVSRFQLELVGFVFDFWLLFFNGDGCFLRWGNNCWFARTIDNRDHITYMDNAALFSKGNWPSVVENAKAKMYEAAETFMDPYALTRQIADQIAEKRDQMAQATATYEAEFNTAFATGDIFAVGRDKRAQIADSCPLMTETSAMFQDSQQALVDAVKAFISGADF